MEFTGAILKIFISKLEIANYFSDRQDKVNIIQV